jgi:hypothetical protein
MLSYDPVPGVFNLAHAIEEAREEGDGDDSDEEADEVLLHDEARLEVEQDLQEAQDDNEALEDKDSNSIIMIHNNPRMAIDPLINLPPPPDTCPPPPPTVDKGEPMYDHYKEWQTEVPTARDGATQGNLFPSERVGCLGMTKLCKCGISKERMVADDALFFHHLLLPM